jgi:hypothetical protein
MTKSYDNVRGFEKLVTLVGHDKRAEKAVRTMVRRAADECPLRTLADLGRCLIAARKEELEIEASLN